MIHVHIKDCEVVPYNSRTDEEERIVSEGMREEAGMKQCALTMASIPGKTNGG